jgi:hypothetical protein
MVSQSNDGDPHGKPPRRYRAGTVSALPQGPLGVPGREQAGGGDRVGERLGTDLFNAQPYRRDQVDQVGGFPLETRSTSRPLSSASRIADGSGPPAARYLAALPG